MYAHIANNLSSHYFAHMQDNENKKQFEDCSAECTLDHKDCASHDSKMSGRRRLFILKPLIKRISCSKKV